MSELLKKLQQQHPKQGKVSRKQQMECNYRDNYYGDKTCVPCSK